MPEVAKVSVKRKTAIPAQNTHDFAVFPGSVRFAVVEEPSEVRRNEVEMALGGILCMPNCSKRRQLHFQSLDASIIRK